MRMMKIITIVTTSISALLMVGAPIISSLMQGYYKAQIDLDADKTRLLLAKKQAWVQIGESKIFFYVFIFCAIAFLLTLIVARFQRRS